MSWFDQWVDRFDRSNDPSFQAFYPPDPGTAPRILYGGYQKCAPGHAHSGCRPHALFHWILDGKGIVRHGGSRFEVEAGQGFLFFPGTTFSYRANTAEPWSYFWLAIGGRETPDWLRMSGMHEHRCVVPFPPGDSGILAFFRSWAEETNTGGHDVSSLLSLGRIGALELFRLLNQTATVAGWPREHVHKPMGHSGRLRQFIEENYSHPLSTTVIAKAMHLERSHCCTLFARSYGMGMMTWLSDYRLQRAAELLLNTNMKLSDIAVSVGIEDSARFSKKFKTKYGASPGQWRRSYRKPSY